MPYFLWDCRTKALCAFLMPRKCNPRSLNHPNSIRCRVQCNYVQCAAFSRNTLSWFWILFQIRSIRFLNLDILWGLCVSAAPGSYSQFQNYNESALIGTPHAQKFNLIGGEALFYRRSEQISGAHTHVHISKIDFFRWNEQIGSVLKCLSQTTGFQY